MKERSVIIWVATAWVLLVGLYLLFAGDLGSVEIVASQVCATAGTALAVGLKRTAHRRFAGWPPSRAIFRPLAALIPEALAVGREFAAAIFVLKEQRGAYVWQGFDPGGEDPTSAGRRAAVVLGTSLAPGSFVICGDCSETIILHALPRKVASSDHVWAA